MGDIRACLGRVRVRGRVVDDVVDVEARADFVGHILGEGIDRGWKRGVTFEDMNVSVLVAGFEIGEVGG